MDEVTVVLVVCLLAALLIRIYWRLVLNILVILGISLIVAGIFVIVQVVNQVNGWV